MRILYFGDLHCPCQHPRAVEWLRDLRDAFRPHAVVCTGDIIDAHSWSRYPKGASSPGATVEWQDAVRALEPIYSIFPKVRVATSNHEARIGSRADEAMLPAEWLRSIPDILQAPSGWRWADEWVVDGVRVVHGDGYSGEQAALNAACDAGIPTVIGHLHATPGVLYRRRAAGLLWGMNVGSLIDPDSFAFLYGKHARKKPIISVGVLDQGVPTVIPMRL